MGIAFSAFAWEGCSVFRSGIAQSELFSSVPLGGEQRTETVRILDMRFPSSFAGTEEEFIQATGYAARPGSIASYASVLNPFFFSKIGKSTESVAAH